RRRPLGQRPRSRAPQAPQGHGGEKRCRGQEEPRCRCGCGKGGEGNFQRGLQSGAERQVRAGPADDGERAAAGNPRQASRSRPTAARLRVPPRRPEPEGGADFPHGAGHRWLRRPGARVGHPPGPRVVKLTAEDLWRIKRPAGVSLAPDGTRAVCSLTTYSMQENKGTASLWLLPTGAGRPRLLTTSGEKEGQPMWAPQGSMIAYV